MDRIGIARKGDLALLRVIILSLLPLIGVLASCSPVRAEPDTAGYELRVPPEKEMQEVREKKVFQYDRNKDPDTWWTSFKNFLWENFFRSFSNEGEPAFKWLYYILKYGIIGGAVLLLIRFLYKNSGFSPFRKTAEGAEFDNLSIAEENIQKRDLDEEIREALDKKDHKKAVRTHFLKVLQRLDDMGSIQYSPEKTNSEHMEELRGSPFESGFRTISDIYEAIWYGDFRIDERDYEEVALQFNEFEALIDQDVQRVQ